MPREAFGHDYSFLARDQLLTFEEITRLTRLFQAHGVEKLRLTGGEPLLRRDLPQLIAMLASLPNLDLTLTTNGVLLAQQAESLKAAGLHRVTVSLDALDNAVFQAINDVGVSVERVLEGIEAAAAAGLRPVKINMVVKRGLNDESILPMARYFHGTGHVLRFIEYMDVGATNGWRLDDVVPAGEILTQIHAEMPLEPTGANYRGEVAQRWRYRDGGGEIGIVASVTQAFCRDCTRARLSAEGKMYTCLFSAAGHDLRALLRDGASDDDMRTTIARIWEDRSDRYSEIRSAETVGLTKIEMSYIGG
jgi:cyclic pyranopterin phosphate synthase